MTMTAGNAVCVDANGLVYATFNQVRWHAAAHHRLAELGSIPVTFWTSRQVLREFLAVTTRPGFWTPLPPVSFLEKKVNDFARRFQIAADDGEVTAGLPRAAGEAGRARPPGGTMPISWPPCAATKLPTCSPTNTADFDRYQPWITVLPLIP